MDIADQLAKLQQLRDSGAISDDEFVKVKTAILQAMSSVTVDSRLRTASERLAMSDKESVDVMAALAKSAYERYEHRTDTLYKLRLALWTAFGVATWLILTADKWKPGLIECVIESLITIGLVLIVVFIWGKWTYPQTARLPHIAYYWVSAIEYKLGEALPASLRPNLGGYVRYPETLSNKSLAPWYKSGTYLTQALITTLFGLIVIMALFSNMSQGTSPAPLKTPTQGDVPRIQR